MKPENKGTLAFCVFKYFPYGGLQRNVVRIGQACQEKGWNIRAYAMKWEGAVPEGFELCRLPVRGMRNHTRARSFYQLLQDDLKRRPVDGVVGFNRMPGLDIYYAADVCLKEKAAKRSWLYRLSGRYRQYAAFEKAVFDRDSKTEILMISRTQEPFFVKHYQTQTARMHFLPPNVSPDCLAPENAADIRSRFRLDNGLSDDELLVVQVGSGFVRKGADRSIRAIASLPRELRERTRLWLVGQDRPGRFKALAARLGVAERVVFTGPRDDVPEILLGADLLLHPAYNENTGTVLLEAVAAALPVLCTAVCGYGEHIKAAGSGLLTPEPFEQDVLNGQLKQLLEGNRDEMRRRALAYAKTHDLYSRYAKAAEIIDSIIRDRVSK